MNLSDIKTTDISEWNNDQICAALVEAKKIEKLVDFMKETLRERIENDLEDIQELLNQRQGIEDYRARLMIVGGNIDHVTRVMTTTIAH